MDADQLPQDFKVNFMIIGAQKCGTTSLAEQLAKHPEICFCKTKEPAYFNTTADWQAGLSRYHALFTPAPREICGEASTSYTFLPEYPETHSRLYSYNPELKLIYIMRNPVERIMSHYAHRLSLGRINALPENEVFARPDYINRTRYSYQIGPYLELFGRKNILLLLFEDYIHHQEETLKQTALFLGISPETFPEIDTTPKNKTRRAREPQFSPGVKRQLWDVLRTDVQSLEEIMGKRLDIWTDQ